MSNSLEDLGLADLQVIAQVRGIKDYESMFKGELLSIIAPSKKAKKAKKAKRLKKKKKNKIFKSKYRKDQKII